MAKNLKTAKSFRFTDEELELLEALKAKYGSFNQGIVAAARKDLAGGSLAKSDVIAWIERNAAD